MRLDEFKVLTEAAADNIVTVGDSHAVAIGRAGGFQNFAVNGASVAGIASQIRSVPNGSFVILSAGNNDVSRNPGSVVTDVQNIVRQLQAKDCKVVLVLFPDINLTGPSKAVYDRARYTANYNAVRDALKRVRADGILELRNSDINAQDPMRIHATTSAYKRIADTVKLGAGGADDASESTPASLRAGNTGMSKEDLRKIYLSSPDSSFFGLFNATNAIVNLDPEDVAAQVENQKAIAQGFGSAGAGASGVQSSDVPTGAGAGSSNNAATALRFFQSKGYTPAQAAGIVGNLQAESGRNLNPTAVGDGGKAIGIAQWHPDRRANFQRAFGKPFAQSTFTDQLNFIIWELNNTEAAANRRLRATTTAAQAAAVFDQYYERSSGAHRQARINNAIALLPRQPAPTTAVASAAAPPAPTTT